MNVSGGIFVGGWSVSRPRPQPRRPPDLLREALTFAAANATTIVRQEVISYALKYFYRRERLNECRYPQNLHQANEYFRISISVCSKYSMS